MKEAYELRISDWSSDGSSSDLYFNSVTRLVMRMRSNSPQAFWDGLRDESGDQGVSGTAPAWPTFGLSRSTCDGKLRRLSESMFGFAMTKVESCSTANRLC